MKFGYKTAPSVCSESIMVEINDEGKIVEVAFNGGCPGSLQAVSRLVIGLTPQEAISKVKGINCGGKGTSCPDQLAQALEAWVVSKKR